MVVEEKEEKFRKNLVKIIKSYQKVKNIKADAQKIVDGIGSKELHDMAADLLKTKTGYESMKGGKRSRRRKRKKRRRTRKIQHGGQWELFNGPVLFMCGAAVLFYYLDIRAVYNLPTLANPTGWSFRQNTH
jgi:hypothetical protein